MHRLDNGFRIALDLCVSDFGSGIVSVRCVKGAKCESKGKEQKKFLSRFTGINTEKLCFRSYRRLGSRGESTVKLQKGIATAIASPNKTTPYSQLVTARIPSNLRRVEQPAEPSSREGVGDSASVSLSARGRRRVSGAQQQRQKVYERDAQEL